MSLTIGRDRIDCESFKVRGSYNSTIARLFGLPTAVTNKEPLTLEVTIKASNFFRPYKDSRRIYWNNKFVGFFVLGPLTQEWEGDSYKVKFELKQCERSDIPEDPVPLYKWRFDLLAISQNYKATDGAILAANREVDPFADSWKANGSRAIASGSGGGGSTISILSIARGGTNADNAQTALDNLGGIPLVTKGLPNGVAPLGADGKVPAVFLPAGGGGTGGIPITEKGAAGGVAPLDGTAKVPFANLPTYPTLASLSGLSSAEKGAAGGVAPLDGTAKVPFANLPTYPTLASLSGLSSAEKGAVGGVAPLDGTAKVPFANLPDYPTLSSLGGLAANLVGANNGVAPLDGTGKVAANYLPAYPTLSSLGGLAANLVGANSGVAPLNSAGKVASTYLPTNVSYLNVPQTTTAIQEFNSGLFATNSVGITSVQNAGLTRSSFYFSNPSQAGGQRQSRINYGSNGNIQIQILGDDASTVAYQWEFTASGNMLVPGVMRFQSYTSNPTGASFVTGGIYYNSTLGRLVFSNGTNWIQLTAGANVP